MFCENCGATMSDDAQFCANCGARLIVKQTPKQAEQYAAPNPNFAPADQPAVYQPAYSGMVAVQKKSVSKKIIVAAVIITVAIIGIFSYYFYTQNAGATSPQQVAKIYYRSFSNRNIKDLMKILSPYTKNEIMENETAVPSKDSEVKVKLLSQLAENMEIHKISSIVVNSVEQLTGEDLTDYIEEYKDSGYSNSLSQSFSAIAKAEVTMTFIENGESNTTTNTVYCCKIGKYWYLITI